MFSTRHLLRQVVPERLRRRVRYWRAVRSTQHLFGAKQVGLAPAEAVVTCVVRNGERYIERFVQHYSEMGFRHIFFLDNGSSDQTIPIAQAYRNVSVFQSLLPIDGNQTLLKRCLAERSSDEGWCLDADIDEFFDYPYSDTVPLGAFLEYLNGSGYTAVITQLLDMFSDRTLGELQLGGPEDLKTVYQYYDLTNITSTRYRTSEVTLRYASRNRISNDAAALKWGGVRKTLYGNNCLLTKHSLFRLGVSLELFPHVHFVNKACVADVSGVMLHYKLVSDALTTAMQNSARFVANRSSYEAFVGLLARRPDFTIKQDSAKHFRGATALSEEEFLFSSAAYEAYVQRRRNESQRRADGPVCHVH